jgi:hypothetical protein
VLTRDYFFFWFRIFVSGFSLFFRIYQREVTWDVEVSRGDFVVDRNLVAKLFEHTLPKCHFEKESELFAK